MRLGACLLLPFLIWAQPALPNVKDAVTDAAGPCIAPDDALGTIISKIEGYGWTLTQTPNDDLIEDLAWIHAVFYLNSDTGGASLDNILGIQRKAALGFLRKKDIPQSKSRFFQADTSGTSHTLMLAWRKRQANVLEVECRYSIRLNVEGVELAPLPAPFYRAGQKRVGAALMQISVFDEAQYPDHTPPSYVIHTSFLKVSP